MSLPTDEEHKTWVKILETHEKKKANKVENSQNNDANLQRQFAIHPLFRSSTENYGHESPNKNYGRKFGDKYTDLCVSSIQCKKSTNLLNSLLFITEDKQFTWKMHTNDGRFLFFSHYLHDTGYFRKSEVHSIFAYDLFNGTTRFNRLPYACYPSNFTKFGEYFLFLDYHFGSDWIRLHILKINHNDLSAQKLKTIIEKSTFDDVGIVVDQLGGKKFALCGSDKAIVGCIENDEITMGNVKNFEKIDWYGKRLVGNLLEGFTNIDDFREITFCTFDLEAMEKTEKKVPMITDDFDLVDKLIYPSFPIHCWTNDTFYKFYEIILNQHHLLSFDSKTLKWSCVNISVKWPMSLFVDENEVLTFQVGKHGKHCAFYRVALRKPDTLKNLTQMAAVRESNLYGNDKYINFIRQPCDVKKETNMSKLLKPLLNLFTKK